MSLACPSCLTHPNSYASPSPDCTHSGINILGEISWGSHFCGFYETQQDLLDILVLYFMEGLSNRECCFWVSADDDEHLKIYNGLKKSIPGLDELVAQNRITFLIRKNVMPNYSKEITNKFVNDFVKDHKKLLRKNFTGVRAAGTPGICTSRKEWLEFCQYEAYISKAIESHKIIVLCCYSLEQYNTHDLMSIIKNHEFSLIQHNNEWEILEKSSIKATKNHLYKINRELEQRVHERTENLLTALHARDQFLAVASHELKTPIAALRLYADGLIHLSEKNDNLPNKTTMALQKIQEQSIDLELLLNNLLDVTGFEKDGLLAITTTPLDLTREAILVINEFNDRFNEAGNLVTLEAATSLTGQWDKLRIKQVLKNLIANALKYSCNQAVTVTLSQKNGCVIISIKDQGIGIDKANHSKIFDRFIQLPNKQFVGGFGLGLWIVKQIVEAHKGLIAVKSKPGKGSEFIVTLPINAKNLV